MKEIVLVGAGNMGGALLRGWVANWKRPVRYHVVDPQAGSPVEHPQAACYRAPGELPTGLVPDVMIVAVKPDKLLPTLLELKSRIAPGTIVVSVAAGVGLTRIRSVLDGKGVLARIMPNIGATAGYSVSAGFAESGLPPDARDLLQEMFSSIGQMTWLAAEDQLHVVTAVSGSGPAYFFAFCEALCAAASRQGLPDEVAKSLAVGTAISAGRLLARSPEPEELRRRVTSPNGTTAAGLAALAAGGSFEQIVQDAVDAARLRSVALSQR